MGQTEWHDDELISPTCERCGFQPEEAMRSVPWFAPVEDFAADGWNLPGYIETKDPRTLCDDCASFLAVFS